MASSLPIPAPPRTPTPPSDDNGDVGGLGLSNMNDQPTSHIIPNPDALSPQDTLLQARQSSFGSMNSTMNTPAMTLSPSPSIGSLSPYANDANESAIDDTLAPNAGPFRFQTRTYTAGDSPRKSVVSQTMGQRRGHRYKHSSVSHQIFQEPAPRAPLRLPASLPVPNMREGWGSMSSEQAMRVCWCFCHLFVAGYVQWSAQGSLALTALSHLIFYDAIGAFLCAGVEVLSNFEVWKRSSIRQPFGLERSEVLVGFAMSILLLFMGFDLISHNIAHVLDAHTDHEPHRPHAHNDPLTNVPPRVSPGAIDVTSLLAALSTLVSALMLQNHSRMARTLHFGRLSFLPGLLRNPSHLLTLGCSGLLLVLPYVGVGMYDAFDAMLSTAMAFAMCVLGVQLVRSLGAMLLMSYSGLVAGGGATVSEVVRDIETDPSVKAVEEAKFWQVHYGLCVANLKLRVRGTEDGLARLKERVTSLVRNKLGGGYGGGTGAKWEISTQLILEKD